MKKLLCLVLCAVLLCPALAAGASAATVVRSPQNLTVNGKPANCEKYNIDGSNYFKLRDIAFLLMGTESEFGVAWDPAANSIIIAIGLPYEPVGGELIVGEDKSASAQPSSQSLWFLDAPVNDLSVYNIGGNNFFKLRDLGNLLGFSVDFDPATNTAIVETPDYYDNSETQYSAFMSIWDWLQVNYTDEEDGTKEYYDAYDFDDGDSVEYELIAADLSDGTRTLAVISTYYYADGDADQTWIFLEPDTESFLCSYDYFVGGDVVLESPDFSGTIDLDPTTFCGWQPMAYDNVEGQYVGLEGYDFWTWGSQSIANTLIWLDDLLSSTPELADSASIYDFGFTPMALFLEAP